MKRPPIPLVAHRCAEHRALAPLNQQAEALVVYTADQRPKHFPISGQDEEVHAECGGCIAEEVEALLQQHYDHMEVIADLLTSRAELRRDLERQKRFGL